MARSFNGSSQSMQVAQTPIGANPFSMFVRGSCSNTANYQVALCLSTLTGTDAADLIFNGLSASDLLSLYYSSLGSSSQVNSVGSYTADAPFALGASVASTTSRSLYSNAAKVTDTASRTLFAGSGVTVGAEMTSNTYLLHAAANLADVAAWDNTILTDRQQNALYKGFSPPRVQRVGLKFYAHLIRTAHVISSAVSGAFTETNSPGFARHPRVYGCM